MYVCAIITGTEPAWIDRCVCVCYNNRYGACVDRCADRRVDECVVCGPELGACDRQLCVHTSHTPAHDRQYLPHSRREYNHVSAMYLELLVTLW